MTEWKGDILAVGVTEKDLARDANSKFENVFVFTSPSVWLVVEALSFIIS